jgi:hypothetical protein
VRTVGCALTKESQEGREIVVDLDLEKFFDRVNHDVLRHGWVARWKMDG